MTVKEMKKLIKTIPDDCEIFVDMAHANDATDIECAIYHKEGNSISIIINADIRRY